MSQNLARLVGSPLGGIVVEAGGPPAVVIADGVTFQSFTPAAALGRVIATGESMAAIGSKSGVLAAGACIDLVGVRPMLDVQGTGYVVCGLIGFVGIGRRRPTRTAVVGTAAG